MKVFRILGRNIRDSFRSLFRNTSLSLASIVCITITLIVVSISILLSSNVNNFADLVEKDVTIVAFLDVDIDDAGRNQVEEQIKKLAYLDTYTYQSKMEISKEMMDSSEVFKNIMQNWTEEDSPIQDTFLIKVTDIEKISDVAEKVKAIDHVEIVKYGEGMVEQLVSVFDVVHKGSLIIVATLIVVTAFLISNTIKITIFSRKREIEIMRLVGASNINIKIPFVIEGLFLGVIGSIIPILITTYGYVTIYNNFNGQLFSPFIKLITPSPFIYVVSLILIFIGAIVGMLGSLAAVRKYLKV